MCSIPTCLPNCKCTSAGTDLHKLSLCLRTESAWEVHDPAYANWEKAGNDFYACFTQPTQWLLSVVWKHAEAPTTSRHYLWWVSLLITLQTTSRKSKAAKAPPHDIVMQGNLFSPTSIMVNTHKTTLTLNGSCSSHWKNRIYFISFSNLNVLKPWKSRNPRPIPNSIILQSIFNCCNTCRSLICLTPSEVSTLCLWIGHSSQASQEHDEAEWPVSTPQIQLRTQLHECLAHVEQFPY